MTQEYKTTEVSLMDFSKIFKGDEHFTGIIQEVGLPMLFTTNKAMYKCVSGKGIIEDTGEKYDTYDQITREFDFSGDHPIWQNTYKIIGTRPERELQILTYHIVSELSSIMHINSYFNEQWENIKSQVSQNIEAYKASSALLPEIPMLKEHLDGFFVECKNLISHLLTIFKLYYQGKTIIANNPKVEKCLEEIKKDTLKSKNKNELINIFERLKKIGKTVRAVRNAISHPENYKENFFLLYNVHWENNRILFSPIIEYKTVEEAGQLNVLDFTNETYTSLLEICGSFFNALVQDMTEI